VQNTIKQYDAEIEKCKSIFLKKFQDYGAAWRILRPSSLTDQLYIKASRIRSIEEKGMRKVNEPIDLEYRALVNYGIMALIQLELGENDDMSMNKHDVEQNFDKHAAIAKELMMDKNHDYGEAWRDMRIGSITDLILMKLLRAKQIEENEGRTIISEGIDANYLDIMNYALFALIKIEENKVVKTEKT